MTNSPFQGIVVSQNFRQIGDVEELKPVDSCQWQDPLKDRTQANQYHEQFQEICQTTVVDEPFNDPKTNSANDANNKNVD